VSEQEKKYTEQDLKESRYKCIWCGKKITMTKISTAYVSRSKNSFNDKMIWCKDCVNEKYNEYLFKYDDIRKAVFFTCRKFDIPFFEDKLNWIANQLDESNCNEKAFGAYMQKIYTLHWDEVSVCFDDGVTNLESTHSNDNINENDAIKWGSNFSTEDCDFLNIELEDWKLTHKCETKAEKTLLKEICIKELEIRKARTQDNDTKGLVKELQELMKTAAVDGAKANAASAGKSAEAYSLWIKDIEERRPAEYFEDKKIFHDVDDIDTYFKQYVTRPTKNFITGNRDFNVNEDLVVE